MRQKAHPALSFLKWTKLRPGLRGTLMMAVLVLWEPSLFLTLFSGFRPGSCASRLLLGSLSSTESSMPMSCRATLGYRRKVVLVSPNRRLRAAARSSACSLSLVFRTRLPDLALLAVI
ncbi:unnamed protein product [Macrosiphum euphorbiae]|uniref:Uncharacterized protein n=1 Tax=Macrosiphum euphorbiae TaxID=13131 RepID=A0AAV0X847_9HEMI|nr:unnamed protein product [Macrosiphum euphorbiae]